MKERRLPEIENRKARHLYFVEETMEAGIVLSGTEVKSIREAHAHIGESYVDFHGGEAWIYGCRIEEFLQGNRWNHEVDRRKKLLMHGREIAKWSNAVDRKGYTVVPLKMYFKDGKVKVLIGMCRGKAEYDKRQTKIEQESKRDIDRALKGALRR